MSRFALIVSLVACAVLPLLPVVPVQADMIVPCPAAPDASGEATGEGLPATRVGAFLSGEEWWEVPIGLAALVASGWAIYHFAYTND